MIGPEFNKIESTTQKGTMRVGASLQVGEVDETLYKHYDLSLPTSSLIPYVTVAGLASNAGHGTGKEKPSFSGLIRGMTLCLPNGEIKHIDSNYPDFAVISGANLGLFGVIIDLDLECTQAEKMHCSMRARSIPELIEEIRNGLFQEHPYVSVMYVPTYQDDELTNKAFKNVIIYSWKPVKKSTADKNKSTIFSFLGQQIEIDLDEGFHVDDLLRQHPTLIPFYNKYLVSQLAIGNKDSESIGPWYEMHYQKAYPWNIDDADYLFQVHDNGEEMVTALLQTIKTLNQFASKQVYPITDAVYLRLFRGTTDQGLSTSNHTADTRICGFDMVTANGIKGYPEFKTAMCDYFINGPLQAKPHWGKYLPKINYVELYGDDYHAFIETLHNWYQENKMSLENSMLLTKHFCDLLQLKYAPLLHVEPAKQESTVSQKVNTDSILNALHNHLADQEDEHAINLKKQLSSINADRHFTTRMASLQVDSQQNSVVNEPQEKEEKCCVIL